MFLLEAFIERRIELLLMAEIGNALCAWLIPQPSAAARLPGFLGLCSIKRGRSEENMTTAARLVEEEHYATAVARSAEMDEATADRGR